MDFVLLVLSHFDRLDGGVECVLGHSPSEIGMVTPSEGCVNGMFFLGVIYSGIIPGVFSLMTSVSVLALLVLMMSGLYVSVLLELGLQCH